MAWADIREFSQSDVLIPFEGNIWIDVPAEMLRTPTGRRLAVQFLELELNAFSVHIAYALSAARDLLGRNMQIVKQSEQVLPWLPAGHGRDNRILLQQPIAAIAHALQFEKPLLEQLLKDLQVATIQVRSDDYYDVKPMRIFLDRIEFEDGSLRAKIKGTIAATAATATLAFAAFATPLGQDAWNQHQFHRQIAHIVEGQKCALNADWGIDLSSLEDLTARQLNYLEPGISEAEKTRRACDLQTVLAAIQGSPQFIDGVVRKNTLASISAFAKEHGVPADAASEVFRGRVLFEFKKAAHHG